MRKNVIGIIFGLACFVVALSIIGRNNYQDVIQAITWQDLGVAVAINILLSFVSGCRIAYLTGSIYKTRLRLVDYLAIPLLIKFWGYLIPMKGGLVFSTLFLKMKYNIKAAQGVSLALYSYLISVVLAGIWGLYYSVTKGMLISLFSVISILFILSPLLLTLSARLLSAFSPQAPAFQEIKKILLSINKNCATLSRNLASTFIVASLTVGHILARVLLYYWAARACQIPISFAALLAMSFMITFTTIFRLIPGNLGVDELLGGSAAALFGSSMANGITIVLFVRFVHVLLAFGLGPILTAQNMKYFKAATLRSMWDRIKTAET